MDRSHRSDTGTAMTRISADTKQATRARLLAAAAQEFGRAGFERANVDAISLAAGYAKGTIYNYFPAKEELFLAVVQEASAQAAASDAGQTAVPNPARADASNSEHGEAPARQQLGVILHGFCAWARRNDAFARVLVRECLMGTPGLYPQVIGSEAPLVGKLAAAVREGAGRGELRADVSPELLALAIAGLTDLALAQHWASDGTSPRIHEIPELVLTLLFGPDPSETEATKSRDLETEAG